MVMRSYQDDYLGEDGPKVDLEDFFANCVFEDPETTVWISAPAREEPTGQWHAVCQFEDDSQEFQGTREEVVAWARAQPATRRRIWTGQEYADLEAGPHDAPAPPSGPTVQVHGPNHDGRWAAVWFHRGEVRQFWSPTSMIESGFGSQPYGEQFLLELV